MTPSPISVDERLWSLQRLAQEYGIEEPPESTPLSRPSTDPSPLTPNFKNANDELKAEELLKRRRLTNANSQNGDRGGNGGPGVGIIKKRSFTLTRKDSFPTREIYEALETHVANHGSPGVADALIHKLRQAGGDVNNINAKSKTPFLKRRSMTDAAQEQSRILQKAIENSHEEMVAVLVPHADHATLDAALPIALRTGHLKITEMLLKYGANLSSTPEGQFMFQQLCINGEQADLVGLLLQSDGRPPPDWISGAMIAAAKKGDLDTVVRLSRSVADANFDDAAALKAAIAMCRVDIALAILTGNRPPAKQHLNDAFQQLFTHTNIMPTEKKSFADILLLAGAEGDVVSEALVQACETEFYEMIELLISYGASIEFEDALVVRNAIKRGSLNLVELLLNENAALSPQLAAGLIESIPKRTSPEHRRILLNILLRKGAQGDPLDDALIDAVETQDLECVKLLLLPQFAGTGRLQPRTSANLKKGPRSMVYERHAVANVNHKGGLALSIAVKTGNVPIVDFLISTKPNTETLVEVFPNIHRLDSVARCHMTESFLQAGVSGPCVHAALQNAIDESPPRRDERLIKLLLQYDVDMNANDGAPILSAVEHVDADLLEVLVQKTQMTPKTVSTALKNAMAVDNKPIRARMVRLLLQAAAEPPEKMVGESFLRALQEHPVDLNLLSLLLNLGRADVNMEMGDPMLLAVRNEDPRVLELMLQAGKPTAESMDLAVQAMSNVPSSQEKVVKFESILKRTKQKETLNPLLVTEVQAILRSPPEKRTLVVLKAILAAGVDVNTHKAAALCHAVGGANSIITDVLFSAKPSTASLQAAMPHALKIQDPMERLSFTAKLLNAGAPAIEANRALVYAIGAYPEDFALINTLVAKADTSDGEALMEAVRRGNSVLVELILTRSKQHTTARLNDAFVEAAKFTDQQTRRAICELLLRAGATGQVVSDALLAAAGTGDLTLGTILLNHGASVDHQEGQAVVEACRAGSSEVLKMLLATRADVNKETLERGFQAATEIRDYVQRAEIFHMLLEKGVNGPVVDAQLVSAARFGDDAVDLVRLLLRFGASTDYNGGEAVYNATRCAFLGILEMMLGIAPAGGRQTRPSHQTMTRALKASWKLSAAPRYQVMAWLFAVGLPVTEDVHVTLSKAVNEDEVSIDLIRLLLENGAVPTNNGCKSLIDVVQKLHLPVLELFLGQEISQQDLTWTFAQSFTPAGVDTWLSEPGFEIAQRLVERGAQGDGLSRALNISIDSMNGEKGEIARKFVGLLIQYNADINQDKGAAFVKAAQSGSTHLLRQMLRQKPNTESVSMAFPYVLDHEMSEDEALELVSLFADYREGETRLDPLFCHPESPPVIFKAISNYPRSTRIVQTLLDAGYYHDQMGKAKIFGEIEEEEQVNLLLWCLLQPQKKVSTGVITLLIEKGAKVNFETRASRTTPLMVAIRERRHDIVKQLVLAGAEVDVADITGNTPLTLTTQIGGDLGTTMMSNILAAEPSQNDGSLHNAARDLNLRAMQVLVDFGHEVDFPSPLHGGRTALGELCLHAADSGPLTATQEKAMEKAMSFLMKQGTDLSLLSDGKSVLLLAMESNDPVPTARALLKVGMWKDINRPWNHFTSGGYTYSPTQYAKRVLRQGDVAEQLHALLKANRAQDIYFANEGPQPEGAIGLPDDIVRAERERKARLERIKLEAEDHVRTLERTKEVATIHDQIFKQRAQLEEAHSRQKQHTEIDGIRERALLEEQLFHEAVQRQKAERAAALEHQSSLTHAEVERTLRVTETEVEANRQRQNLMIQYEKNMGAARVEHEYAMNAARRADREDIDAFEKDQDIRIKGRMAQEKKLIEQKTQMAASLAAVGMPQRRQIGYISGELD